MKFYVTPLIHPIAIRADQWAKEPAQQEYLSRVVRIEKAGETPPDWDTERPPPGTLLYPSLDELDEWWDEFKREGYDVISHDLETAGQFIICDGLTPVCTRTGRVGHTLVLRFRGAYGVRWWSSWAEHLRAVEWYAKVLADPSVCFVGHNVVGFDIPILFAHGFEIPGVIIDTMVLMSRAYPEMQKGLQFCATLFLWAPAWKRQIKEGAGDDEVKG